MLQDLREVCRRLARQPVLAIATIVVLACAVAAVTTVIGVADAVVWRPLPFSRADRIVMLWETNARQRTLLELSYPNVQDWRAANAGFDELAAMGSVNWSHRLTGSGEPEMVSHAAVSAAFFRVMGTPPALGRTLTDDDDTVAAAPVAVVSHGFWQRRLGGSPAAIGRTITLDERGYEVVGVMPPAFDFPRGAELWTALVPEVTAMREQLGFDALAARGFHILFAVGRLRDDVSREAARADLDRVNAAIDRREGGRDPHPVVATSIDDHLLGTTRPAVWLLLAAVLLILILCAANVATLLLMRALSTRQDAAVRLSLGASRGHIFRLRLAEAGVLFAGAAAIGIWMAWLALPLVRRLAPDSVYRMADAGLTPLVVAAVAAVTAAAAVAASVVVTLASMRDAPATLANAGRTTLGPAGHTPQQALVAGQCALALVLVTAGVLTVQSLSNLRQTRLGFDPSGLLTFEVLPSPRLEAHGNRDFYPALIEAVASIPGVTSAAALYQRPLAHDGIGMDVYVLPEGHAADDEAAWRAARVTANWEAVTPAYFSTMRIPLRHGRGFTHEDTATAPPVAVLGDSAARRLFPGTDALGRQVLMDVGPDGKPRWRTVVGVADDVRYRGLLEVRADIYVPHTQTDDAVKHVVVRADSDPLALIAQVRQRVRQVDPQAVIGAFATMSGVVDRAMAPWRLYTVLFAVLGALGVVTTVMGLYATVRYYVVARRREWGIRAALGASAGALTSLVCRQSLVPVLAGVLTGCALAVGFGRMMAAILVGAPRLGVIVAGVAVGFLTLAAIAAFLPGREARRADPSTLLRST